MTAIASPTDAPVLSPERARALAHAILAMTSTETTSIELLHTAQQVTRIGDGRILSGDDGAELLIKVEVGKDRRETVSVDINQTDDAVLRGAVARAEAALRAKPGRPTSLFRVPIGPQQYLPVNLWRDATIDAMANRRSMASDVVQAVQSAGLVASGFEGMMARCGMVVNKDGLETYYRETDCECTVTARLPDGSASGWAGQAHRDWSQIDPHRIAASAIDLAKRGAGPRAVEPGRRTAVLAPPAVLQLLHVMTSAFDAAATDNGGMPFSKHPMGNKIGLQVFDQRITIASDPDDPEGGYRPDFSRGDGLPQPRMIWVENGVLKNLAYDPEYAVQSGKPYAGVPWSFHMSGGSTTIEEMIASCREGIYVNRFTDVDLLDWSNGITTGVTCDGCFLVRDGKIDSPVKNFRFADSPWFVLNQILALGPPQRVAFGYTPPGGFEGGAQTETQWPRPPVIVPPMMVRDFNFVSLADAV